MSFLKKFFFGFLFLIVFVVLFAILFYYHMKPDYQGDKGMQNLSDEVEVYFDSYGIPHIYAQNERDAFTSLGYVHAQDRLWQMEVLRRIGSGGLSEIFGKDLVATDQFFLALGIDDASAHSVASLDRNATWVPLAEAYLDGINQFIEEGPTPIEFYLTGIEKENFELKDVYNTVGYMAFSFAMAHKTDPLLTKIRDKLGQEYLKDLAIDSDTNTVWIKNYVGDTTTDSLQNLLSSTVFKRLEELSIPLFEGSNGWVIAPEKTSKGKVIFANDPHIGFSQPSVWYEAHVSTPNYEKYGYHLAGVPFPILGHNRSIAYGMTMFENDDIDFYFEQTDSTDSTKYLIGNERHKYETVSKKIQVKDSVAIDFSYRNTIHGPVLNGIADNIEGDRPIAMSWVYTQLENKVLEGLYGMTHAQNISEFQTALHNIHAPGLNIMYGDAKDNIAWWATAKLYQIPDSIHTKFIFEQGQGLPIEKDYLGFSQNPHAVNPPNNYVYSANNQPDSIAGLLYPGYYLPENRAKRIVQLLTSKGDWNKETVGEMMNDVTSPVNTEVVVNLLKQMDTKGLTDVQLELLDKLKRWKGDYPLNSIEATIYHRWMYFVLTNTFNDELGPELFESLQGTHLFKRTIAPFMANTKSIWWDDTTTKDTLETQKEIVNRSFREAWKHLESSLGDEAHSWSWGRVHTLEHGHPIGQVAALRSFFNVGPFPVNGTREVINNMYFPYTEDGFNKVTSGPSTRRVIDFSDVENSMSILPTGQSGNPFSPHYKDQAELFVNGEFRKMMMNEKEIKTTSKSLLRLVPAK